MCHDVWTDQKKNYKPGWLYAVYVKFNKINRKNQNVCYWKEIKTYKFYGC